MILWTITPDQAMHLVMWIVGGTCALAITILVHIGNAGSAIKKDVAKAITDHAETATKVEYHAKMIAEQHTDLREIKQDVKTLLQRK